MEKLRTVEVSDPVTGGYEQVEMTNLDWSMQYVLLKIQEMVRPSPRIRLDTH